MADGELIVSGGMGAIAQITGAETDMQIATARKFPRDLEKFKKKVEEQVTSDLDIAISMSYKLEREDKETGEKKDIISPSVRFAEVVALAFGNMRVGARVAGIDENFVTVQGMAWDLESNFAQSRERMGSIRTKKGFKYSQDMIKTTANAQASTAYREAVLKTIPQALWGPLWEKAQAFVAAASGEYLATARQRAISYFVKKGISQEQILAKLGRTAVEEVNGEDMSVLGAIYTAVKDENADPKVMFNIAVIEQETSPTPTDQILKEMKEKSDVNVHNRKTADEPKKDKKLATAPVG